MITHPTVHDTFVLERTFGVPPARAFAAWSDPELKARWFIGPENWKVVERTLDFRVGGREVLHGAFASGVDTIFLAQYRDIVPNERVVYAYDMMFDGNLLSISLATLEFRPTGAGTRLVLAEQGAFFDGSKDGPRSRERGAAAHLDRVGKVLNG